MSTYVELIRLDFLSTFVNGGPEVVTKNPSRPCTRIRQQDKALMHEFNSPDVYMALQSNLALRST